MVTAFKPTRYEVAQVYARRAVRWRRNSSPFLSGDAFADLADVVIDPPRLRRKNPIRFEVENAETIFIESHKLQNFLDLNKGKIHPKVIIAGNSDYEFKDSLTNVPDSVKLLLLQNSFISDNQRVYTLPIGIENFRWGVNGNPVLFNSNNTKKFEDRLQKILIGPFGNTHHFRQDINETFSRVSGPWNFYNGYIPPKDFSSLMFSHKYIAAVRGNGIDTHRAWEAFYRGSYPLVADDKWSQSLSYLGLPFIQISDWNPETLSKIAQRNHLEAFDASKLEPLWMDYWIDFIKSKI